MTWEPTPWAIGGGAVHTPEIARLLAFAATSGAEGIVTPTSLRVQAQPAPNGTVRIAPGAALILNRYAGSGQQTYVARNTAQHNKTIAVTGSSGGRTDLVIARVHDPQYGGQQPTDPTDFQYVTTEIIQGVPAGTASAADLNLGYPAIALARITRPANTTIVENSHITDLRRVAIPRKERHLFTHNLEGSTVHALTDTTSVGQYWPNIAEEVWNVWVPEWATEAKIVATWGGVRVSRSAANGTIWVRLGRPDGWGEGNVRTQDQKWALDLSALAGEEMRETWVAGDEILVPAALRGTTQPIRMMGRHLGDGSGPPRLDNASSVTLDVEFVEVPV